MALPKYVVDTCSFTTLNRIYPYDVMPGAWDAVSDLAENGILISSNEVFLELEAQDDGIFKWAQNHISIFLPLDENIQITATEILKDYPNILDLRQSKSSADPFVIATAKVKSCCVVTEEQPNGPGSRYLKIPNVCRLMDIDCINMLEMLRIEGVRLKNAS